MGLGSPKPQFKSRIFHLLAVALASHVRGKQSLSCNLLEETTRP